MGEVNTGRTFRFERRRDAPASIDCLGGAVFRKNELLREFLRSDITRLLRQRRCLCALEACSGVIVCCIMIIILLRTPNRQGREYEQEDC